MEAHSGSAEESQSIFQTVGSRVRGRQTISITNSSKSMVLILIKKEIHPFRHHMEVTLTSRVEKARMLLSVSLSSISSYHQRTITTNNTKTKST